MFVIVGLGNPGKKYENTRHNMGFIAIDLISKKYEINVNKIKHKSLVGEGIISGQRVLLVKPQTFMNSSGEAVREILNYYKIDISNLIVIYDDIDIPTGTIRLRKFGSAGTHNGMKSVVYQVQSDRFPRVRIGIGSGIKSDLIDYVTGNFTKKEIPLFEDALTKASEATACIVQNGIDKAMNDYNQKSQIDNSKTER